MSSSAGRSLWRDASLPALIAGFVTVLVGFASSAVIVFQAARTLDASQAQIASWMWALALGMGINCIGLSLRYRMPVVAAWSTPGAALLISGGGGLAADRCDRRVRGGRAARHRGRILRRLRADDPAHPGFAGLGDAGRGAAALRPGRVRGDAAPIERGNGDVCGLSARTPRCLWRPRSCGWRGRCWCGRHCRGRRCSASRCRCSW